MLIRREDFGKLENLTKGSNKRIWFACNECGIGILRSYKNYYKNEEDLCRKCQNKKTANRKDIKEINSKKSKEKWNDSEYRENVSKKISESKKEYWNKIPKSQRTSGNKRSFEILQREVEEKGLIIVTTKEQWENKEHKKPIVKCPYHPDETFYFRKDSGCPFCNKNKIYIPEWEDHLKEINYRLVSINGKRIQFECNEGHIVDLALFNWRQGYRCPYCNQNRKFKISF